MRAQFFDQTKNDGHKISLFYTTPPQPIVPIIPYIEVFFPFLQSFASIFAMLSLDCYHFFGDKFERNATNSVVQY